MKQLLLRFFLVLLLVTTAHGSGMTGGGGGGSVVGLADDVPIVTSAGDGNATQEKVATEGTGVDIVVDTGPSPDTITFAFDVADNITWTGTWTNQGVFLNSAASAFASSVTLNSGGYIAAAGSTAPAEAAGTGVIYYDNTADKWKVSQNNGGYADLVVAGGTDLSGAGFITDAASGLLSAESVLTDGMGIDTVVSGGTATIKLDTSAALSGDHTLTTGQIKFGTSGIIFEGPTADAAESYLTLVEPAASDKTWTLPNVTGTIITTGDTGTVTGTMLATNTVGATDLGICSSIGGVAYHNGTQWICLGIGATDDVLTVAGGIPAWEPNSCEAGAIGDVSIVTTETETTATNEKVLTAGDATSIAINTVPDPDLIEIDWVPDGVTLSVDGSSEATVVEAGVEALLDLQDLQGAVTNAQVPNTITIDLAATATALAANGADCSAGSYATGVDASGAATGCTVAASVNHETTVDMFDEFCTAGSANHMGNTGFHPVLSGTGTSAGVNNTMNDLNHPCVVFGDDGDTATGRAGYNWGATPVAGTGGAMTLVWYIRLEDLSVAAEEYIFRAGFLDTNAAEPADGLYFKYDRLNLGANWQAIVADSTVLDTNDTGVVVAADAWIKLEINVDTTMSSIVYQINDTTVHTANAGNADLPEVGDEFGPSVGLNSSADTADVQNTFYIDYMHFTKVIDRDTTP